MLPYSKLKMETLLIQIINNNDNGNVADIEDILNKIKNEYIWNNPFTALNNITSP